MVDPGRWEAGGFPAMSDAVFQRLSAYLSERLGIKLPEAKRLMLQSRIRKRLNALGLKTYEDYCRFLFSPQGQAEELDHLFNVTTTNKTNFFREPKHFEVLAEKILPDICSRIALSAERPLVVWSAGCSTGEEPYSLAMVLAEYAAGHPPFAFTVLASDISTRVIEAAQTAVYRESDAADIPGTLKRKYLLVSRERERHQVRIVPALRAAVRFFRLNLMEPVFALPVTVDIVFCRNVIIYFDRTTQLELIRRFAACLSDDGYLFTGHAETLCGLDVPFVSVLPTVYRKIAAERKRA